jgi:alpha-beta hydrolase superfamily lysophospholipase
MGLITERDDAAGGYEAVADLPVSDEAPCSGGAMLRRRSPRPTRRALLYLHCVRDSFVSEDLVSWYTERGFHLYVADLRGPSGPGGPGGPAGPGRDMPGRGDCFAGLDAACRHLYESEGIDSIIVSAHAAGALTAALWCDARRDSRPPDALILSSPAFGKRLRRGLDIPCPVLVMVPAAEWDAQYGKAGRRRRRSAAATARLGAHVTWLRIEGGLDDGAPPGSADRRRFFDEMGRWLGAYMYGEVRDQLL